jgi:uncharacterized protein DUF1801
MSENQTKPTKQKAADFINAIPDPTRRADAKTLATMMQKITKEKPTMWGPSIVGFGSYHYVYDTGREGDMPLVSFSPRKAGMAVYVSGGFPESDALRAKLKQRPKGCLNVKSLASIDHTVLETLVTKSVSATRKKYQS